MQGPFKGDTTAKAADALAEGVKTACSKYALEREKTTEDRLKRELKEQKTLDQRLAEAQKLLNEGAGRQRRSRPTTGCSRPPSPANTLSNVMQRQNQLDQFIGEDQSLLSRCATWS